MLVERMFGLLFNSPLWTLYAFGCTIILCVIFQIFFLLRAWKKEGKRLSIRHFIGVFVFLIYLMAVYKVTGMGTAWDIGRNEIFGYLAEIHWIPF